MTEIEIEIDGQKLTAEPNQTVIQVADAAGIYIPRFCYHKHLSIAANCRMCLVEVEKAPKALPACATPVMPGMKVFTKSQKTIDAQRAVMEFLLINHPLDCPICDQGGECELQDLSMGYGASRSNYNECKRAVPDEDLGALISTDMTRCIYCTRCVRFGEEIAGLRELGATYRGEHTEIGTFVKHAVTSEVSGNVIDLCPVGALTSKPYRFTARAWELDQTPGVSPHDCLGTNVNVHTRYGKVMRVVSRENNDINQTWIADRDRFSYTGLYHADRVTKPRIKVNNEWQDVEWEKALKYAAAGLKEVIARHGADKFAGLASPSSTLEEFYLLQKLVRELGSPHVDHRLREQDTRDECAAHAYPGMEISLDEMEKSDAILVIGSNIQKEVPLISLRIRAAQKRGAKVLAINSVDYKFNFTVNHGLLVAPHKIIEALNDMLKGNGLMSELKDKQKVTILLGMQAMHHPQAAEIRQLAKKLAEVTGAKIAMITDGANSAGGWLAGAVPHRQAGGTFANKGMNAYEMLAKPRDAYLLLDIEPEYDCANAAQAVQAMEQAAFVVALSVYNNPAIAAHADVILPVTPFTETSGTFVNMFGHWQSFQGMAQAVGESRPAWKVLRVLANFLELDNFNYESTAHIKDELKECLEKNRVEIDPIEIKISDTRSAALSRIGEIPIYAIDSLTRHAEPLQTAQVAMEGDVAVIKLNPVTAAKLQLVDGMHATVKQNAAEVNMLVEIDVDVAPDAAWVAGGIAQTQLLGDLFGEVTVQAAK